jgi:hypothetical protein
VVSGVPGTSIRERADVEVDAFFFFCGWCGICKILDGVFQGELECLSEDDEVRGAVDGVIEFSARIYGYEAVFRELDASFWRRKGFVRPRMKDVWLECWDGSRRAISPPKEVDCMGKYGLTMPAYGTGRIRSTIACVIAAVCCGLLPIIMIGRPRRARSYRIYKEAGAGRNCMS